VCSIFWDAVGDRLYASQSDSYHLQGFDLLRKLRVAIKQKRRGKSTRVPLRLHDNAPAYRLYDRLADLLESGFEEMRHPPYSSELAGTK